MCPLFPPSSLSATSFNLPLLLTLVFRSYVMYPEVFSDWERFSGMYGDSSVLPTRNFITPMSRGEEVSFEIEKGKTLFIKLLSITNINDTGHR